MRLALDGEADTEFLGRTWTRMGVPPGLHVLRVRGAAAGAPYTERLAEVPPGGVARLDLEVD